VWQKEESPEGHFSINQRGVLHDQQHQNSFLPAARQGEGSHENTA
jgi:hypothetical protein